jgi:hypothetical protein
MRRFFTYVRVSNCSSGSLIDIERERGRPANFLKNVDSEETLAKIAEIAAQKQNEEG